MFVYNTFEYTAGLIINNNTSNNKYAFYSSAVLSFHFITKMTHVTLMNKDTNYKLNQINHNHTSKSNHSIVQTFNEPTE